MKNKHTILVFITLFVLILLSRWVSHLWNFTLVGGALLFAGSYFKDKKISFTLMLSALLVSDLVIGFHDQMPSVYLSYLIIVGLGFFLAGNTNRVKILGFSFLGSFLFYAITNFAVWLQGTLYPMTFAGLMDCYVMAIPFYRNQLISDILSSLAIFEVARFATLNAVAEVNSK
ncbi:MAG: DUF6580 family putative transport protein [Bdellovibrionota bacterium]